MEVKQILIDSNWKKLEDLLFEANRQLARPVVFSKPSDFSKMITEKIVPVVKELQKKYDANKNVGNLLSSVSQKIFNVTTLGEHIATLDEELKAKEITETDFNNRKSNALIKSGSDIGEAYGVVRTLRLIGA